MWIKGQSGNPAGRPKLPEEFKMHGPEAVKKLLKWIRSDNPKASVRAIEVWLHYWLGKPKDTTADELIPAVQSVIEQQAVLKMMYDLTYPERNGRGATPSDQQSLVERTSSVQARTTPA